jgi:hypothetical protein
VGKVTGSLRILSLIVILSMIGFVIGCSDSNPVGKTGALANSNNDEPVTAPPDDGKDDLDFDDGGNLFDDDTDGLEADEEIGDHLYYGLAAGLDIFFDSKTIDYKGGEIKINEKYDPAGREFSLAVRSYTFSEGVTVGLEVRAGLNVFNEELYLVYVTPCFQELKYNLIFSFKDDPVDQRAKAAEYRLFYFAGGRWIDYGSSFADENGLVRQALPAFGLYAVLKQDSVEKQEPNLL